MVTIDKQHVSSVLLMEAYAESHQIKERITYFNKKYGQSFFEFEKQSLKGEENFEMYDDYIEWKAYINKDKEIEEKINDLKRGKFQVS